MHMPCVKGCSSGIDRRFKCTEFFYNVSEGFLLEEDSPRF